jgi:hypothetical protein
MTPLSASALDLFPDRIVELQIGVHQGPQYVHHFIVVKVEQGL